MIKNECGHAYKLLDHAECLWCENCVEKLAKRLNEKPQVTRGWIEEKARGMKQLFINCDELPMRFFGNMPIQLMRILKEAGVSVG